MLWDVHVYAVVAGNIEVHKRSKRYKTEIYLTCHLIPYFANMEPVSHLIKVSIPNYLAGLPIPDSIGGWFRLGVRDWLSLIPPTAMLVGLGYMSYRAFCPLARPPCGMVNPKIKKDSSKVVDVVDIENIAEKAVFCRCWRSENWPYCDGTHGKHNKEHCDNVGPLVVERKKK